MRPKRPPALPRSPGGCFPRRPGSIRPAPQRHQAPGRGSPGPAPPLLLGPTCSSTCLPTSGRSPGPGIASRRQAPLGGSPTRPCQPPAGRPACLPACVPGGVRSRVATSHRCPCASMHPSDPARPPPPRPRAFALAEGDAGQPERFPFGGSTAEKGRCVPAESRGSGEQERGLDRSDSPKLALTDNCVRVG